MITVSTEYLEAVKSVHQEIHAYGSIMGIAFTDANIVSGSLNVSWQFCDNAKIQIGTAYVGEASITLYDVEGLTVNNLYDKTMNLVFGTRLWASSGQNWNNISIGDYVIKEVELTDDGIRLRTFDNMIKFDRDYIPSEIGIDLVNGSYTSLHPELPSQATRLYHLIYDSCDVCGVEFGTTPFEFSQMPNASADVFYNLFTIDVKTYRDLIAQIAEFMGAFATINNMGKLVFKTLKQVSVDTVTEKQRFSGTVFSGYHSIISAVALDREDGSVVFPQGVTSGLIYELDNSNSFFHLAGTINHNSQLAWIENALEEIYTKSLVYANHVPFTVPIPPNTAYELGDVITFTGGRVDDLDANGITGMVSKIVYSHPHGTTLYGVGENPLLNKAKSREILRMEKYETYRPYVAHYFDEHVQVYQESDFDDTAEYDENTIIAVVEDYT